jgi:RNA polymerase sigma-70 factor, ECF subfamily
MKSTREDFLELLNNYQGILYKVSLVYFRNRHDREDNLQEIIFQLWKSYPTLKNHQSVGSWIYAVAINTSIARVKKNFRIEYREKMPELTDPSNFVEEMAQNESLQLLLDAIHGLDEVDKSIMLLYLEEKSYEEIAEIIGITKSNAGVRINRAKERLKQNLNNTSHGKH